MRILLLGNGGREHTLAWKISQSAYCSALFVAPGNAGTRQVASNQDIDPMDFDAVRQFCHESAIDLVVVGPEAPLVKGIVENFKEDATTRHIPVVGPSAKGAQLEGSKEFAKQFMLRHKIPTAAHKSFTSDTLEEGKNHLRSGKLPIVLKADGLAAGKGVLILNDREEACRELENMLGGKFGSAGNTVVVEQFLSGIEFSVFALTDGKNYQLLPVAKDYKRIGEGDTGLNTGGMGSVSPVPFVDEALMSKVRERIIEPTIRGLAKENIDYRGFVFFGLINVDGDPFVIEYNCRMGDPETQVVMPRLKSDLVLLMKSLFDGTLENQKLEFEPHHALATVLVSGGYPGKYAKGTPIKMTDPDPDTIIFHAGTKEQNGSLLTDGGRVIATVGLGDSVEEAGRRSAQLAEKIDFEGKYYRKDIGFDL